MGEDWDASNMNDFNMGGMMGGDSDDEEEEEEEEHKHDHDHVHGEGCNHGHEQEDFKKQNADLGDLDDDVEANNAN